MKTPLSFALVAVASAFLSSCITSYELPKDHTGPTAIIRSTGRSVNAVKGEGYHIAKVNGVMAIHSPMDTPHGGGMGLMLKNRELQVPCTPLELTLYGGNIYAADGAAMVDSMIGGNQSASGKITFTPKPKGDYTVNGVTSKQRTAVWIEDTKTKKIVSGTVE